MAWQPVHILALVTSHFTSKLHAGCATLLKFHVLTWENFIKKLYFFLEIPMWVLLVGRLHEILTRIKEALKK